MKHPPQEADLIPGGRVAAVTIGVVAATAAGVLVAWGLGRCTASGPTLPSSTAPLPAEVNAMEMRVFSVEAQGIEFHRRAEEFLASYGWVDPDAGIVHVPIEVAFALYLARQRQGEQR